MSSYRFLKENELPIKSLGQGKEYRPVVMGMMYTHTMTMVHAMIYITRTAILILPCGIKEVRGSYITGIVGDDDSKVH